MSKSILLIGSNGQVGTELQNTLSPNYKVIAVTRPQIDLTQAVRRIIYWEQAF